MREALQSREGSDKTQSAEERERRVDKLLEDKTVGRSNDLSCRGNGEKERVN